MNGALQCYKCTNLDPGCLSTNRAELANYPNYLYNCASPCQCNVMIIKKSTDIYKFNQLGFGNEAVFQRMCLREHQATWSIAGFTDNNKGQMAKGCVTDYCNTFLELMDGTVNLNDYPDFHVVLDNYTLSKTTIAPTPPKTTTTARVPTVTVTNGNNGPSSAPGTRSPPPAPGPGGSTPAPGPGGSTPTPGPGGSTPTPGPGGSTPAPGIGGPTSAPGSGGGVVQPPGSIADGSGGNGTTNGDAGLPIGAVFGISVAGLLVAAVLAGVCYFFFCKSKDKPKPEEEDEDSDGDEDGEEDENGEENGDKNGDEDWIAD